MTEPSQTQTPAVDDRPPFDPEVWWTWPIPTSSIIGRKTTSVPRLDSYGEGWCDGFEMALRMAHAFHETGEWVPS